MPAARRRSRPDGWPACKRVLAAWPSAGLLALVRDLYRLSDENRRFLRARLLSGDGGGAAAAADAVVGETIRVVERMLAPRAVWNGEFRHSGVKRVIDQFAKAVADPAAVAQVLLADLAVAFQTFSEIGDFEPIVDHIYATMKRLDGCANAMDATAVKAASRALDVLAEQWGAEFGWGVSDEIVAMAEEWPERSGRGAC